MKGQFNAVTIIGILIVLVFLGAFMPALLGAQADLLVSVAGHPVEMVLAGLIVVVVLLAFIQWVFSFGQPRVPYGY
jgi:hypothetical protein